MRTNEYPESSYALSNTDGETIAGGLSVYSELARKLGESNVGMYLRFLGDKTTFGTALNVQRRGRRPDTVLFIITTKNPVTADIPEFLCSLFLKAIHVCEENQYEILNIWGDSAFVNDISELNRRPEWPRPEVKSVRYSAGKISAGQKTFVLSKDLARSVSFVAACITLLRPVLHLGLSCAISRRTFDADLSILPDKPPAIKEEDANIDSGTRAGYPSSALYIRFLSVLEYPEFAPAFRNIKTREELSLKIATWIYHSIKEEREKEAFLDIAADEGIDVDAKVQDILHSVARSGRTRLFERYIRRKDFNADTLIREISKLPPSYYRRFWEALYARSGDTKHVWRPIRKVIESFSPSLAEMGLAFEGMREGAHRISPAKKGKLPKKRRRAAIIIATAIICIIVASAVFLFFIPGGFVSLLTGDQLTESLITSGDGMAVLTIFHSQDDDIESFRIDPIIPPQNFSEMKGWTPASMFYRISPEEEIFTPAGVLHINLDTIQGVSKSSFFIARNSFVSGPWEPLNTSWTENGVYSEKIERGGIYGVFYLSHAPDTQ